MALISPFKCLTQWSTLKSHTAFSVLNKWNLIKLQDFTELNLWSRKFQGRYKRITMKCMFVEEMVQMWAFNKASISQQQYYLVIIYLFIHLGFYVAFNTVQVISWRVVGRAEETSTYSSSGFCTVNCPPTSGNYQLSHSRPCWEPNPGFRGGRRECYHSATVAPILFGEVNYYISVA